MGRLRARTDYENLKTTRMLRNQKARLGSLGVQRILSELSSVASSKKSGSKNAEKNKKIDMSPATIRRSSRLEGKSYNFIPYTRGKRASAAGGFDKRQQLGGEGDAEQSVVIDLHNDETCKDKDDFKETPDEDDVGEENDYETLRKMRISENQARLASLGLQKALSELRSIVSPSKQERTPAKKWINVDYSSATLRRSDRLKGIPCNLLSLQGESNFEESDVENKKIPKYNSALLSPRNRLASELSPEAMARRCASKGRGSLYDGIYGICCHSCRQKKLCGEEDCRHCSNLDLKEPCIGKTECSVCHSSTGIFCRACLKIRYGEEMDDVRENKQWMCPHCVEEKGVRPYWICNSSICLNKRKMVPTGIAIYKAKEMGYESVAHLLMDKQLQRAGKGGR